MAEFKIVIDQFDAIKIEYLDGRPVEDWMLKSVSSALSQLILSRSAHLYILRHKYADIYKIGFTSQPLQKRISQVALVEKKEIVLMAMFPCASVQQARNLEFITHAIYKKWRIRGEWYKIPPEEIDHLRSHRTGVELINRLLPLFAKLSGPEARNIHILGQCEFEINQWRRDSIIQKAE